MQISKNGDYLFNGFYQLPYKYIVIDEWKVYIRKYRKKAVI